MSAAASAQDATDTLSETTATPDLHLEGDWTLYRQRCDAVSQSGMPPEARLQARQTLALAYLGRRAQWHGGVFSSTQPTVLTAQRIAALTESNTARREQQYPWLAQMLAIVAELEKVQHSQMRMSGRVLSFPPSRRLEFQLG